jgi:hypothetical protein
MKPDPFFGPGGAPPAEVAAPPPPPPPPLESGQGVYRRDRPTVFKLFHLAKVTPRRRAPRRISMPRPPFGRDRCLRLLKAINTKNEITFGKTFGFVIEESRQSKSHEE